MLREIEEKNRAEEERVKAAITIQCYYRMYFAKELLKFRKYRRDKNAAIKLVKFQARVRGVLARKAFKEASKREQPKMPPRGHQDAKTHPQFLVPAASPTKAHRTDDEHFVPSSRSCGRKDVKTLAGNYHEDCGSVPVQTLWLPCHRSLLYGVGFGDDPRRNSTNVQRLRASQISKIVLVGVRYTPHHLFVRKRQFCEWVCARINTLRGVARCRKIKEYDHVSFLDERKSRASVLTSAIKKKNVVVGNDEDEVNDEDAMILNELRASAEQCKKPREKIERSVGVFKKTQPSIWKYAQTPKKKKRLGLASASTASYPSANVVAAKSLAAKKPISIGRIDEVANVEEKIVSIASPPVRHSPRLLELKRKRWRK